MRAMTFSRVIRGFGFAFVTCSAVGAQTTLRVDLSTGGAQANLDCRKPVMSGDGRYVAFAGPASNLVPGDTNGAWDVFVRDRDAGTTERVSVDSGGMQGNDNSGTHGFSISGDGRRVAFASLASTLVPGDTNGAMDVFVHDRISGTTERVSVDSGGLQANGSSLYPAISADGRYVAFESDASNLVAGDANMARDIFVHDRVSGATERVSIATGGAEAFDWSARAALSADGRYVAFASLASNLVAGDTFDSWDVFVRDRVAGTTEFVSVNSGGTKGNADSGDPYFNFRCVSISSDGRFVAFSSWAANLVTGDTDATIDAFVRDRTAGTTERVSVSTGGGEADGPSTSPAISGDGRYVAFEGPATNLVAGDTNGQGDVFLRDRLAGTTERMSVSSSGGEANQGAGGSSISSDGRFVAFESNASNLVPGDTNGTVIDDFVRDRSGGPAFTSQCAPGAGGVIGCPCSNPPSGSGRGCDNSAGTGGATLSASGATVLSSDSLVLTTSGEKPTALSVVFQGTTSVTAGVISGQGVRCAGGALKRLFSKSASGGSITAPDFGAGDPTVSARSAAKGDVIPVGGARWYFVVYRDPSVLGGCPAASTFNATTTGQVVWSP